MDNEDLVIIVILHFHLEAFFDVFGIIELLQDFIDPWPLFLLFLILFFLRFINFISKILSFNSFISVDLFSLL